MWLWVFGDIFDERRAAPPAYGRRAWSKVVSHLMVFRYVFGFWSEFRRCLNNRTVQTTTSYAFVYCVTAVENFVVFQHLKIVEVDRCSKKIFWTDCFRWPEGPPETIQFARRNKKAVRNIQLRSNDAWLGYLTTTFEWNVENC